MDRILTKTKGFFKGLIKRRVSLDKRKARSGYLFVLPFLLGVLLIYLPILLDSIAFSMSRSEFEGITQVYRFVGLQYYKQAFATSSFTENLLKGLQQLVFQVPAIIIFSLFIAVILNQDMLGRAAFRAIFFFFWSYSVLYIYRTFSSKTSRSPSHIGQKFSNPSPEIISTILLDTSTEMPSSVKSLCS